AVLSWWMLLGGPTVGEEDGTAPAASPSRNRPVPPRDSSNFDPGQGTPAPPVTPAPAPAPCPGGPPSHPFLLSGALGLRSGLEEQGLSFYVSSTQFEQGVAAGGLRQAFRWGGKFDMLAHVDSEKLGLWRGGMLDLFAETRLGQSVDGFAGVF